MGTNRQQNFKKHPHTARFLAKFHAGNGQSPPAEITADGRKLNSDGNEWIDPSESAALAFLRGQEELTAEAEAAREENEAPGGIYHGTQWSSKPSRPVAGYLVEFQGHQVRCGDGFITEAQAKWIVDILVKRQVEGADNTFIRLEQGLAKYAGRQFITNHKNAPLKPIELAQSANYAEAVAPGASTEDLVAVAVPAGRYALRVDGVVKFYKLDRPTEGRWAGYTFLKAQGSDELYPIRNATEKARILAAIAEDLLGAERLYGMELGKCSRCGRTLTDETSRAYGIGPECRKK